MGEFTKLTVYPRGGHLSVKLNNPNFITRFILPNFVVILHQNYILHLN